MEKVKTTIEFTRDYLEHIKKFAQKNGMTLKQLIEIGLERVMSEKKQVKKINLKSLSFKPKQAGLINPNDDWSWKNLAKHTQRYIEIE